MGKVVLMVAEKPSLAESIAKLLAGTNEIAFRKGLSNACGVSEFQGTFRGEKVLYRVTSVTGHVYSCDFPREFNNWDVVDPATLFDAPIEKIEANPKSQIVRHLAHEAKGVDYLVLWLDNDREGENICFEVSHFFDICRSSSVASQTCRRRANYRKRIGF